MNYSKDVVANIKDLLRENRKHGAAPITAEQSLEGLKDKLNAQAPFLFYLKHVLKRGDTPPRGKHFKNRVAGMPIIICDELWYNSPKLAK